MENDSTVFPFTVALVKEATTSECDAPAAENPCSIPASLALNSFFMRLSGFVSGGADRCPEGSRNTTGLFLTNLYRFRSSLTPIGSQVTHLPNHGVQYRAPW